MGAGFSSIAGLPLTNQLFDGEVLITSQRAEMQFEEVFTAWNKWTVKNPLKGAEQFISEVYLSPMAELVSWSSLVSYLTAKLATPLVNDRGAFYSRYADRITRPINVAIYDNFWDTILNKFSVKAVVTLNYDIIVERGLRHRQMIRTNRPGIYYGGIPQPQVLKGNALPFTVLKSDRYIELTGKIPLFKLHGSLNWGLENGELVLYQDLRPSFRRRGIAQIIPPVEEKEIPKWLLQVWEFAKKALSEAHTWFICGYSLPEYDVFAKQMFSEAASSSNPKEIIISDPYAKTVAIRWNNVSPNSDINLLPGLPYAISLLA